MVQRKNIDFGRIFCSPFESMGHQVLYQPCCQAGPYDRPPGESRIGWPLKLPEVNWDTHSLLVLQCYDFLTIRNNQCLELEVIERFYKEKSNRVVVVHWEYDLDQFYSGPLNLAYFPCHSMQLIDDIVNNKNYWEPFLNFEKPMPWQCLNGRKAPHRQSVVDLLLSKLNLEPSTGILGYADRNPLSQWPYSTYAGTENFENWIRLLDIYNRCSINIVTETVYVNPTGIITEKTLLAFASLQVPLVIGYQGIVSHCEKLGFDMFSDVIDITHDSYDNTDRHMHAIEKNSQLLSTGVNAKHLQSRLQSNQQWLLYHWPEKLVNDYNTRAADIHSSLTNGEDRHTAQPS